VQKKGENMDSTLRVLAGKCDKVGVTKTETGYNFCVYAHPAVKANLCIFLDGDRQHRIPLSKTDTWFHSHVEGLPTYFHYAYELLNEDGSQIQSRLIVDPYARALSTHFPYKQGYSDHEILGIHFEPNSFDWGQTKRLNVSKESLIIYEMHIRAFTQDPSSNLEHAGLFSGAEKKLDHLKELGINAVELLPIMEFNECEVSFKNPIDQTELVNFWGYSTLNFFSLMKRYTSTAAIPSCIDEFKKFIKACHERDIAVILDVVYNHTGEFSSKTHISSFGALSPEAYYILEGGKHTNYSGCGNTLNSNHPITQKMIIDSLRYYVEEFQIDGFRFDLASIFMRDPTGTPIEYPPIIKAIDEDQMLQSILLIAEPWDAAGLYHVGSFPNPFLEWNGWYRDIIRQFINLGNVYIQDLMEALKGSPRLYIRYKKPFQSINFVTCHDGFCMQDLVSYQYKHNEANGEENRDGSNSNISINFGIEGETTDPTIRFSRKKQVLNFFSVLFTSFGTPMLYMGDEIGHTKKGNNNPWCQDNQFNWLNWNAVDEDLLNGLKKLIALRKSLSFLNQIDYTFIDQIQFLDARGNTPDQHTYGNFIAMTFYDKKQKCRVYFAYNTSSNAFIIELPKIKSNQIWELHWNTYEFLAKKGICFPMTIQNEYPITGQTCMIAISVEKS
jgi:isoamylase/glycogen operon protein